VFVFLVVGMCGLIAHSLHLETSETATQCNTVQHSATQCNTLPHTATHCHTPQHTATQVAHPLYLETPHTIFFKKINLLYACTKNHDMCERHSCVRFKIPKIHINSSNYRALLWKMTYKDKASYGSSPPCTHVCTQ